MSAKKDEEHQRERFNLSSMLQQLINNVRGCPCFVLGVPIFCSDDEVKKAYRKLSSRYHPDKSVNATKEVQALNEEKMKSINSAKKFLDSKKWKFIYESYYKQMNHPRPFNHSMWSSHLIGKPESSGFAVPSSPRQVHSYEDSYDKAKIGLGKKWTVRKSNMIGILWRLLYETF
jgi:curved DNA-binding protein CbpA